MTKRELTLRQRKIIKKWLAAEEDLQACQNCGRVVLAGKCCNNPSFKKKFKYKKSKAP